MERIEDIVMYAMLTAICILVLFLVVVLAINAPLLGLIIVGAMLVIFAIGYVIERIVNRNKRR